MTTRRDALDQAHADLELLTKKITTGTADRPRHPRIIDLALQRMTEWANTTPPPHTSGPHGGTTSPTETNERIEDQHVGHNATLDHQTALTLIHSIAVATERLHALTLRYTKTIDHTKLPKPEDTIPGCVSCARTKKKNGVNYGGFFRVIDEKNYPHERLCRWCGDHARADAVERHLPPVELDDGSTRKAMGDYPPIEAVDILHRQTEQAAGKWLAEQRRKQKQRKAS